MKGKITTWRVLSRAAAGLVCLMFAGEARAIELFRPIPLPDDGGGSIARGVLARTTPDSSSLGVAGSKMNGSGRTVPIVWNINLSTGAAISTELPLPMGVEGEALGGLIFPNGDRVVIGNLFIGTGPTWGALWRKAAMGAWGMPQALCQDAERSLVARADYCGEGFLAVAGSAFEGGRWLAVLHFVSVDNVVTVDIPTPPGSNSAAVKVNVDIAHTLLGDSPLILDDDPLVVAANLVAGGWMTDRQGRERPVVWMNSGQGWATFPSGVRNNGQGRVNDVLRIGSGWAACGNLTRANGSTIGFSSAVDNGIGGQEASRNFLPPLNGFANSVAESFGSIDGGMTFGRSMNAGGEPVATGWIGDLPFPVNRLMLFAQSLTRNEAFRIAGMGVAVGQAVVAPGGQPQACIFNPSTTQVPDRVSAVVGTLMDTNNGGLISLWHDDNSDLRLRTERSGGMQEAMVDLTFTPLGGPSMPDLIQFELTARADSIVKTGAGTLEVYAVDFMNPENWVEVGSFQLGSNDTAFTGTFSPAGFIDPRSGAIILRLEFTANGNRPAALVCNRAALVDNNSNSAKAEGKSSTVLASRAVSKRNLMTRRAAAGNEWRMTREQRKERQSIRETGVEVQL